MCIETQSLTKSAYHVLCIQRKISSTLEFLFLSLFCMIKSVMPFLWGSSRPLLNLLPSRVGGESLLKQGGAKWNELTSKGWEWMSLLLARLLWIDGQFIQERKPERGSFFYNIGLETIWRKTDCFLRIYHLPPKRPKPFPNSQRNTPVTKPVSSHRAFPLVTLGTKCRCPHQKNFCMNMLTPADRPITTSNTEGVFFRWGLGRWRSQGQGASIICQT